MAALRSVGTLGSGAGEGEQGALAGERAALEPAARGGVGLHLVREAAREDPLAPALHDRRLAVQPERELKQDQVGPEQLRLLGRDVGRGRAGIVSRLLLERDLEEVRVNGRAEIGMVYDALELHRIEVGDDNLVSALVQGSQSGVLEGRVERFRLRMSVDHERLHGRSAPP
jgi:hypothetical protein